jgi:hypothetical protein
MPITTHQILHIGQLKLGPVGRSSSTRHAALAQATRLALANFVSWRMSASQTEKYSARGDLIRSCPNNGHWTPYFDEPSIELRRSIVMECRGPLCATKDPSNPDRWRPRRKSACLSLSDYFAEAACSAGLPKTLRQPSLRLARCLRMQAVIRCTFGISDAQSRRTSLVQSRR